MKIMLIHLSDLHIGSDNNSVMDRMKEIWQPIKNFGTDVECIFLIITGDIANSGASLEYKKADEFIDMAKKHIHRNSRKNIHLIMVPGNHDCNFNIEETKTRAILVKNIQQTGNLDIDDSVVNTCCGVQKQYFELVDKHVERKNIIYSDKLIGISNYSFGPYNIIFNCYNTAWISEHKEKPGNIYFPVNKYATERFVEQSNLNISIFHHTPSWFNPTNRREFLRHVENSSHIVFTGHEHVSDKSMKDNLEGTKTFYIEATQLEEAEHPEDSGYKILIADLNKENLKIFQYKWNGTIYKLVHETDWQSYHGEKITDKILFPINDAFSMKFLHNVGAQIRHPNKPSVELDDIFVFPHISEIGSYRKKDKDFYRDVIDSTILCNADNFNRVLLVGGDNSGKTTFCKIIFKYFHNNNYVPIYIQGHQLTSTSIEAFYKLIDLCYLEQYVSKKQDNFIKLDNSKKVIIIDDLDKSRLPTGARSLLLKNINENFPKIMITGGTLLPIDEVLSEEKQKELSIDDYEQYHIREFGHLLRSKLIERWNTLGKEGSIKESEIIRKNDEAQQVFNTIIGRNYVPSYPIFLLIILQAIEAGNPHELEESSFGYYYQYLIYDSLSKVVHKNEEMEGYYNFLSDFAYYVFKTGSYEISIDKFRDFHTNYCSEYAISNISEELINFDLLISNLITAGMIEDPSGIYKIKFAYIFNFFVARYLANNLNNREIREEISNMCKRIYIEQYADIIMFLTHHSKDPFILNEILTSAKLLFEHYKPIKFENDMDAIKSLLSDIPKLVLEDKDIHKHRREKLQRQDAKEFSKQVEIDNIEPRIPDLKEPIKPIDLISELNVAFKTIEILGQVLKNYSGSLKREMKLELGKAAYMLGLRSLNPFYLILAKNRKNLINWIGHMIGRGHLSEKDIDDSEYRVMVFSIFAALSYGFIKVISSSVGSERLSPTFKEILDTHNLTSVSLIDASIKLDFYKNFPYEDLRKVKEKVEGNILPHALLREMVREYLYMFPTSYKDRQRICELVGITMMEQRMIEQASTQKKLLSS